MRPLSLYWRRRHQMPVRIINRRMTSSTHTTSIRNFITRVVLHSHHHHRERERELRVVAPRPVPVVLWQRANGDGQGQAPPRGERRPFARRAPWLRHDATVLAPRVNRHDGVNRLDTRARRESSEDRSATPRGTRPPVWQSRPHTRDRGEPMVGRGAPHWQRRAMTRESGALSAAPTANVAHTANASPGISLAPRQRESSPLIRREERVIALGNAPRVWRASRSATDPAREHAIAATTSAAGQPLHVGSSNASGSASASPMPPPLAKTITAPVLALDGPALDRLAEDVMSRIDRRIRIERERRGL